MSLDLNAFYKQNLWWRWNKRLASELAKHSQIADTRQGPIEYSLSGKGPVVLGIHGTPGGYEQVMISNKEVIESGDFCLLSVSRPGYGRTPLAVGKTPAEQADALMALLDFLKLDTVAVVCLSGGGPTALQLAIRHSNRVRALVLTSSVTKLYAYKASNSLSDKILRSSFGMWLFNFLARYATESIATMMLDELSTYSSVEKKKAVAAIMKDSDRVQFIQQIASVSAPWALRKDGLVNDEQEMSKLEDYPLESIAVPTLVIHGACDGDVSLEHGENAAYRIPNAKMIVSERGTHLLELGTDYKVLAKKRVDFLRQYSFPF